MPIRSFMIITLIGQLEIMGNGSIIMNSVARRKICGKYIKEEYEKDCVYIHPYAAQLSW